VTPSDSFQDFILDQLDGLGHVVCQRMFGGHGLYRDDVFFGVLSKGRLYFKIDDATRPEYERRGMEPFRPSEKQTLSSYYEVPVDVLEDRDALVEWARKAVAVQEAARKSPKARGKKKSA
jgi:DNA transformation protein